MKLKNKWALLAMALVIVLAITACGTANNDEETTYSYDDEVIIIESEDAGNLEITIGELRALESVTEEIIRKDDAGNVESQYPIKGVLLETVLAHLALGSDNLDTIRFTAGDGYSVEVPNSILTSRKIILAYEIDGKPLIGDTQPLRMFIPEEESMYWVKNTIKIGLSRSQASGGETDPVEKIVFFESLQTLLEEVDYAAETNGKAVRTRDVFKDVQAGKLVHMLAADGFEKNEEYSTVIGNYIVVQGENTPAFRAPDLPRGMHVRDLVWMASGNTGFFFLERGLEYFDATEIDGNSGVRLKDLAARLGLKTADAYVLESTDDYSVEVSFEDLAVGIVFFRESGELSSAFEGLSKKTAVKNLLSIRVAD